MFLHHPMGEFFILKGSYKMGVCFKNKAFIFHLAFSSHGDLYEGVRGTYGKEARRKSLRNTSVPMDFRGRIEGHLPDPGHREPLLFLLPVLFRHE